MFNALKAAGLRTTQVRLYVFQHKTERLCYGVIARSEGEAEQIFQAKYKAPDYGLSYSIGLGETITFRGKNG